MWGKFFKSDNEDMQFIHDWLNRHNGKIAYTTIGKFGKELNTKEGIKFKTWLAKNSTHRKLIDPKRCADAEESFLDLITESNDPHILALAKAGNIKILCTNDDALMKDFKKLIKGRIYQYKNNHWRMLRRDTCP